MRVVAIFPRIGLFIVLFASGLVSAGPIPEAHAQGCDIYVDGSASGTGSGTQTNPYTDLQDGLGDAGSGDVVCVAEGTYNPPKRNTPFTMTGGSTLRGGYPNGFSSTTQDVEAYPTVLDGASVQQGNGTAKRVLTLGSFGGTTVVDGVTLQNGNGSAGAGFSPGGWFNDTMTFRDVVFASNDAGSNDGGAVQFRGDGRMNFEGVEFRNNISGRGGALYAGTSNFTVMIEKSIFVGNESSNGGGAIMTEGGTIEMENVLFSGNLAAANGGAFYFDYPSGGSLVNVTISGNQTQGAGGGLYVGTNNQITFENTIIWNNAAGSGADQVGIDYGGSNLLYRYSDIQGSGGSGAWDSSYGTDGGNNIDLNPFFVSPTNPANAPTTSGDLHLAEGSPAVDAGDDNAITLSTDLDGEQRIQDAAVDVGPYEGTEPMPDPEIIYVDKATGSDGNTGDSWSSALKNLQTAIDRASVNTEIWVADGSYYPDEGQGPNATPDDPSSTFALKDRVSIYGGFAGNESSKSERDPDENLVVLSGDLTQDDATNGEGIVTSPTDQNNGSKNNPTNAFHVLTGSGVSSRTVLDGVVITSGSADDKKTQNEYPDEAGGGVFIKNGAPRLSDIRIVGNRAVLDGGGLASFNGGGPILSEAVIESNVSQRYGGGIYNAGGSGIRIRFVTLKRNTATDQGGGLYNQSSNLRLTNVTIEGNEATSSSSRGGGISTHDSKGSVLTNLRIVGNRAAAGGGFYNDDSSYPRNTTTVGTATFSGNYATNSGYPQGGAIFTQNEPISLENSIVWGNGPNQVVDESSFSQQGSLIEGGLDGALNQDPLFIGDPTLASSGPTTDGDLQLQPTSPAVDAGDQSLLPSDVSDIDDDGDPNEQLPLDRVGSQRVKDSNVDMGAYEGSTLSLVVEGTYGADGTDAGWRDLGVPVQGALLSDVTRGDGTAIRNVTPNVFIWEDDASGTFGGAWKQLSNSSAIPGGKGFTVYLRDKDATAVDPSFTFDIASGFSPPGNQDVIVGNEQDPSGNSLPADDPMSTSSQFHFLANPFGVPYDLAELSLIGSGFQSSAQYWDIENKTWNLIDVTIPSNTTGIVAWQGFQIERQSTGSGATQLTFPKEGRLPDPSNTNPYFQSTKEAPGPSSPRVLKLRVVSRTKEGGIVTQDEAANVVFRPEAKKDWGPYDATKWTPLTSKYALIGPVGLDRDSSLTIKAQESLPLPKDGVAEVPLGLEVSNFSGDLTLSLYEKLNVPGSWKVTLIDTKGTTDASDDEQKELKRDGKGYHFAYEPPTKAATRKNRQVTPKETPMRRPMPLEWSSPRRRKTSEEDVSKAASKDSPVARFVLKIETQASPLPVEMASYSAELSHRRAFLKWETASENGNAGFYVQHQRISDGDTSLTADEWTRLGFVEGAGTSDKPQQYQYRTPKLKYGRHAFRLRQVDTEGRVHHTDPVTLRATIDGKVSLSGPNPNPVRQRAQLHVTVQEAQEVTVQLFDVLGRQVRTVSAKEFPAQETRTFPLRISDLSSGTYFVRVHGEYFRRTTRLTVVK